jgi:hypothetical protein
VWFHNLHQTCPFVVLRHKYWLLCATIIFQYMKKWFAGILVVFILTIICIYLFIPSKIVLSKITITHATISAASRMLSSEENWDKWWRNSDGLRHAKNTPFTFSEAEFKLDHPSANVAGIRILTGKLMLNSILSLISFATDSTGAVWQCELPAGNSPLGRLANYKKALEIKNDMTLILDNFNAFISDPKNVYGVSIFRGSTKDTLLLSAKYRNPVYPSTAEIYRYLIPLRKSIASQHAEITGYPMVNVSRQDDNSYEVQVAIPTNRLLQGKDSLFVRRMVPGNFMVCEVQGGEYTIREELKQLEYYINDYGKTVMAIAFQSLVTDRMNEPDTSKWVTLLYVPVRR